MKEKKIVKKALYITLIVYIFISIIMMMIIANFSVLSADDFSHSGGTSSFGTSLWGHIIAASRYTSKMYREWQGTYFSMFIQSLFSPVKIGGYSLPMLRIIMIFNVVLFEGSILALLWIMWRPRQNKTELEFLLSCSILLFSQMNIRDYGEVFTWFSGATSYSLPFSFAILAVLFFILMNRSGKNIYGVLSGICIVISSGGSLTVAGTGCYIMLLCFMFYVIKCRKVCWNNISVFSIGVIGALVNCTAKGNFARHSVMDSELRLLSSAMHTVYMGIEIIDGLFQNTYIQAIIVMGIIIGILAFETQTDIYQFLITGAVGLLTPFVSTFPLVLGYSADSLTSIPQRCLFVIDMAIISSFLFFSIGIGMLVKKYTELLSHQLIPIMLIILFVTITTRNISVFELGQGSMFTRIANSTYKTYYQECINIYKELETGDGTVSIDIPDEVFYVKPFVLSEDETYWENISIAKFFDLEVVKGE